MASGDAVWADLAADPAAAKARLEALAARGALPPAARSAAWRLFLRVVPPEDPDAWAAAAHAQRRMYATLRHDALAALEASLRAGDDADEALEEAADQIRRDVERCYLDGAGESYFEAPERQALLFHALLAWHHGRPGGGYIQGMHEVLATLVWALDASHAASALVCLPPGCAAAALLGDPAHAEADAFWLFDAVAAAAAPIFARGDDAAPPPAAAACLRVQRTRLESVDGELAKHLANLQVAPQIYMLAWLRTLFGRQFAVDALVVLWDAFFATTVDRTPSLPEWLEAAACLRLVLDRERLLRAPDATACLGVLLRSTAAPHAPAFLARASRRLTAEPAALAPLIAALRRHAELEDVFPSWFVGGLAAVGLVAALDEGDEDDSYFPETYALGASALCMSAEEQAVVEERPAPADLF